MQTYTIFFYETKPIFEIKNTLKQMAINYQDNFISKKIFGNKADIKHATFYNKVNKRLHELYGWERKYERIKIIFNENKYTLLIPYFRCLFLL